jgi:hypothetical protein
MGRDFPTGFAIFAIGLAIVALGLPGRIRTIETAESDTLNRARIAESAGDLEKAGKLLSEIAAASRFAWVKQAVLIERAWIAVRLGNFGVAEAHLSEAIAAPLGLFGRSRSRRAVEVARSLRAFVRAARGDEAGAREDIAEVRGRKRARGRSLGRAALAEAIGLERRGDWAGLKELLDREEARLKTLTRPRERALVEGLRQLVHESESASVYRQRGPGISASEAAATADPEVDAWVAQILDAPVDPAIEEDAEPRQKKRIHRPRVRVAVEPDEGAIEAQAELEAEEAQGEDPRSRSREG